MENKRKTLGPINSNQLNSRASLAPGRVTKDGLASKKLSLLGGRPSMGGLKSLPNGALPKSSISNVAGARRSSALGKPNTGLKADPRPVNDKIFQQSCIRYLIGYLSTHGYDQPVSPKTLTSPMSKDFTHIVHFLMRQIDPNMSQKSFGKLEDDVPSFYKRLKYPFQISKSSLFAVGSPHTWPSLLASLVWVTELLSYAEKAERTKAGLVDEKQKTESDFFDYVSESYRCFLAGDDDRCEEVDNVKAAEFDSRANEIRGQNEALQEENKALQARIAALQATPTPLEAAKAKYEEHASDCEKFKKLISNLESHKDSLRLKVQERQSDLQSKEAQLEIEEQECKALQQRISAQAYNREDVLRMEEERVKREETLHAAELAAESTTRRVNEQDESVQNSFDDLENRLVDYNDIARKLQLIPTTAKRACGQQFEGRASKNGTSATEIVNVDFKGLVRSTLSKLKDSAASRSHELVEEMLSLQESLDTLLHSLTERTEENASLTVEVRKKERQHNEDKEAYEIELATISAQADQIKHEISELKNTTIHSVSNSSQRLQQLEGQYEDAVRTCEMEKNIFSQDLDAAIHAISSHKESVTILLQKAHTSVSGIVEDVVCVA